jgi:hypothetical protein
MAMNGPGPIKSALSTIKSNAKSRKLEKDRSKEKGYKYDRNIVHNLETGSPQMLKGSVRASIASGAAEKKKQIQSKVSNVKSKVAEIKKASEARQATKANANREWSGRDSFSGKGSRQNKEIISVNKKKGGFDQMGSKNQDKYKSNKKGIISKIMDNSKRRKQVSKGSSPNVKKKGMFRD